MTITPTETDRFMLKPEVLRVTGLSNSGLWREIKAERFPAPSRITPNRVAWLESLVRSWMQDRAQRPYQPLPYPRESKAA
jgi:prophage regulatory protein